MLHFIFDLLTVYGLPIVLACLYSYHLEDKEKETSDELIQKKRPKD